MSCNDWNLKGIKMFGSAGGYPVTSFDNHLGTIKAEKGNRCIFLQSGGTGLDSFSCTMAKQSKILSAEDKTKLGKILSAEDP